MALPNALPSEALPVYVEFDCNPDDPTTGGYDCAEVLEPGETCYDGCESNFVTITSEGSECFYEVICLDDNSVLAEFQEPSISCYKKHYYPEGSNYLYDYYYYCECEDDGYVYYSFSSYLPLDIPECACNSIPEEPNFAPDDNEFSLSSNNQGLIEQLSTKEITLDDGRGEKEISVSIFPNPFQNKISLKIESSKEQKLKIKLLNMFGQGLLEQNLMVITGKQTFTLNIETDPPEGIYFVLLEDENGMTKMFKLMHAAY